MRIELKDQKDLIDALKREGGYGRKWASSWQVGCPDLICALPGIGLFVLEIKSFQLSIDEKLVDLDVGPKHKHEKRQRYELTQMRQAGALVGLGLVIRQGDIKHFIIVPWWAGRLGDIEWKDMFKNSEVVDKYFRIAQKIEAFQKRYPMY